jgi:hypothetical protein
MLNAGYGSDVPKGEVAESAHGSSPYAESGGLGKVELDPRLPQDAHEAMMVQVRAQVMVGGPNASPCLFGSSRSKKE